MEDIYCLWSQPQKGVPIFLNGVLAEKFNRNDPMPPMDYPWTWRKKGKKVDFPKELWLVTKEKLLLFDYYPDYNGLLVSDKFLELMKKNHLDTNVDIVPLNTVSWKGKEITLKKYFYVRFNDDEALIDYDKSDFDLEKDANMDFVKKIGFGIKKFNEINLKKTKIDKSFFTLSDTTFGKYLFCDKLFKKELEQAKLYGFDIIHYKTLPYAYNEKYKAYN